MADLNPLGSLRALIPDDEDRGQMILLAAFIIAISFVVLALVVNSAIFTENLATRDTVPASEDALEYRDEVSKSIGSILGTVNENTHKGPADAEASIEDIEIYGGIDQSMLGRVVSVSHEDTTAGVRIAQDEPREFTNRTGVQDWRLAEFVEQSRDIRFNLTQVDGPFTFVQEDGGEEWRLTVDDDGGDITVEVDPPNKDSRNCVASFTDSVVIDITRGTIGGQSCPALSQGSDGEQMWFGTGIGSSYNISFENGHEVTGTYSMMIRDDAGATVPAADEDFGDPPDEPYHTNNQAGIEAAVYSMTVTYEYHTPNVGYETEIVVAPGEVPS